MRVGDKVRVKKGVRNPRCGWGLVSHESVGEIRRISGNLLLIRFPEHQSWNGYIDEVVKVNVRLENK